MLLGTALDKVRQILRQTRSDSLASHRLSGGSIPFTGGTAARTHEVHTHVSISTMHTHVRISTMHTHVSITHLFM